MVTFHVLFDPNHHPNGLNWVLAAKTQSGLVFKQRTNSPAKPTGKMLRKQKQALVKGFYANYSMFI